MQTHIFLKTVLATGILFTSAGAAPAACNIRAHNAAAAGPGCARAWMDANLRLNDIQLVGTHNSYHQALPPADYAAIAAQSPIGAKAIDYTHKSLSAQLDAGARQLEIDVVADPGGGLFLHPKMAETTHARQSARWRAAMARPGFKVLHIAGVDYRSSCYTFKACLRIIRQWSDAHPDHAPITILMNTNDQPVPGTDQQMVPFTTATYDALDKEARAALPGDKIITPDEVQGQYPTLRQAVLADNWPTLGASRGKIMFVLDVHEKQAAAYRGGRHSLEGRAMFINTDEYSPAAAYLTLNNPVTQAKRIKEDVRKGFLVRTRADDSTVEARNDDYRHFNAALKSGAQIISTDYLWADPRFQGSYHIRLPGQAAALCNPVRTGEKCSGLPVETVREADLKKANAAPITWPADRPEGTELTEQELRTKIPVHHSHPSGKGQ